MSDHEKLDKVVQTVRKIALIAADLPQEQREDFLRRKKAEYSADMRTLNGVSGTEARKWSTDMDKWVRSLIEIMDRSRLN